MKLTKYQHACLVVEKDGANLVIDPGEFSHDFIVPKSVDGIVITHEHADHLDEQRILAILALSPKAIIIAHESITGRFTNYTTIAAKTGEPYKVGAFNLRFFGGQHAQITSTAAVPANLGVLVEDRLYYPGDSFVVPEGVVVKELAVPASAPWLKINESIEFLKAVKPSFAFPTHDAILSVEGKSLADYWLGTAASGQGTLYKRLDDVSIELS